MEAHAHAAQEPETGIRILAQQLHEDLVGDSVKLAVLQSLRVNRVVLPLHEHDRFARGAARTHQFHNLFLTVGCRTKKFYLATAHQEKALGWIAVLKKHLLGVELL